MNWQHPQVNTDMSKDELSKCFAKSYLNSLYGSIYSNCFKFTNGKEKSMKRDFIIVTNDENKKALIFIDGIIGIEDNFVITNNSVVPVRETLPELSKLLHEKGVM